MTEKSLSNKNTNSQSIQLALPAKITGIVFWGMVLVGLLVAVYLLQSREDMLVKEYKTNVLLMSHDVESILENNHTHLKIEKALEVAFNNANKNYEIEAIELNYGGQKYAFGLRAAGQDKILHSVRVHDVVGKLSYVTTELAIFLPNFQQSISTLRKKMLLIIGSLVFMFGLILQQILQKVLSKPFLNMVMVAEQFADGNNQIRFDEKRKDEFGYMAKFVNKALDAILRNQHELEISRRALSQEKERAEVTLHSIIDGVITTTADARIKYMNPVAERLTGWTSNQARDVVLNNVVKITNEDSGQLVQNPIDRCLRENTVERQDKHVALIRYDGATVPIEVSAAPMRDDTGEVVGAVMVLQDVSQSRRLTKQLSYQASHDALTGLYNRRMFEEQLQAVLLNVQEEERHHALCYIDLDQFKIVNDTCGHMAGDELLRQIAILLQDCIREVDTLARLGGDEFGVLLENCNLSQASQVADKIRQEVKEYRFGWEDRSFEIGASIGVVSISSDNVDMASILSAADLACYAAKDMGRNRVHIYEPTDAVLAERHGQMHWASRIVDAIEKNHFVLYQQPEISINPEIKSKHIEILIRMKSPDGMLIAPDSFIPAAERYHLMPKIDRWVISHVFEAMAKNAVNEGESRVVAINLSGLTLVDEDLLEYILATQHRYGIDLKEVCFEITETAAISNLAKATQFMNELKKEGCQFALDDFGSGLSSFAYLKNMPVDYIKIDGAFVVDMVSDPIDRAMVEAITRLGHVMKIKTIAEWVENQQTLDMLQEIGVDFVQGYHIGKPTVITAFES
jgi:diguanylate cyclase (GGDEF)-like protein/PAS domain S-box-containing protein